MKKWVIVFITGVLASVTQTAFCADIIVDSYTKAGLPPAGTAGRIARVTDDVRGLWMDQGAQWFALSGAVVNVKDFGAKGNQVNDDSSAINSAISAVSNGGIVFFPPGTYLVNSSINIIDNAAGGYQRGITLMGSSGGASGASLTTSILWNAVSTTEPIIKMHSRDNIIKNLAIRVNSGKSTIAAIDIDQASGGTTTCSNNKFENMRIEGALGTMTDGIRIGQTAVANAEYMRFYDVYIDGATNACVNVTSTTGQSKAHKFIGCTFSGSNYGIKTTAGSFHTYGCGFSVLNIAAINLGSVVDNISINDSDSESCARFLQTDGGSSASWAVKISGGRLALGANFAADGKYINFTDGGPLIIENVLFDNGASYSPTFNVYAHAANPGTVLISIGNHFPTDTPYNASVRQRRISLGNRGYNSVAQFVNIPDEIMKTLDTDGSIGLGTVSGISTTDKKSNNLRGSITISDTATFGTVTFGTAEPDANYFLSVAPTVFTGTPATGSNRVKSISKTATGFTVTLETAPGAGNSVTVDWVLIR